MLEHLRDYLRVPLVSHLGSDAQLTDIYPYK
jgi:hypothetical protein